MAHKDDNYSQLLDCSCNMIRGTARKITQYYESSLREAGIKPTQFTILAALANTGLVNGVTHTEAFAALVSEVGQASAAASSQLDTQNHILATAQALRDSFSGVDINEEAIHLLEFQQAFQASTRVIQVINSLIGEILELVR